MMRGCLSGEGEYWGGEGDILVVVDASTCPICSMHGCRSLSGQTISSVVVEGYLMRSSSMLIHHALLFGSEQSELRARSGSTACKL